MDDGTPRTTQMIRVAMIAFVLENLNSSWKLATTASMREIADVRAAKNTRMKNVAPMKPPAVMLLNTLGSVMNIRPGPAFRASGPMNENTAGIIIRPARNAIAVSNRAICVTAVSIFSRFWT